MAKHELPDDLIGPHEAAGMLGLKVGTLASMISRGQIPHYRLSPRVARLSRRELVEWVAQRRVAAGAGR